MNTHISPLAFIDPTATLAPDVRVGAAAHISADVHISAGTAIGELAWVGEYSVIGTGVTIGPKVRIGCGALILDRAKICPNNVLSVSSDGRTLLDNVTIGHSVLLHDEVELGAGAIIPNQRTIAMIGNFGSKNRVVTIYGSDAGPCYSIGCQIGVHLSVFKSNVASSYMTSSESAATYAPYLDTFQQIGCVVQAAYDTAASQVADLKARRRANFI